MGLTSLERLKAWALLMETCWGVGEGEEDVWSTLKLVHVMERVRNLGKIKVQAQLV